MAGLAVTYSKEIIKELDMIPVYYPGTMVKPGDVISFKHFNIFGKPQPVGQFTKEASLTDYFEIGLETDPNLDPVRFSSRKGVSMEFNAKADVGELGKGELKIAFSREGSSFVAATGMKQVRIRNLDKLKGQLMKHKSKFSGDWSKAFIVTSVRTAQKAMMMQSNSNNGSLTIAGEVKQLQTGAAGNLDIGASVTVSSYKDAAFIKEWSDNVEIFFGLSRFRKKFLGGWTVGHAMAPTNSSDWELSSVYPNEVDFSEETLEPGL